MKNRALPTLLMLALFFPAAAAVAADPIPVWNASLASTVSYKPISPSAKPGDWVYVDSRLVHPTQFCLGYREVTYKAKVFSALSTDAASRDAKAGLRPYLAKKDIPIIIAPDGTCYLTDGHHTLAALLASTQSDKTAFGHIVANFFGKPQADFVAFMTDPKNNDAYLYGPEGNGLLNAPGALAFEKLPATVYSNDPATRMANDVYRSLGWALKDTAYLTKSTEKRGEDELFENFIEFRWADLLRHKIVWNNDSDNSFYLAVANADALAHSESTTDLTKSVAARDLPGFLPAKRGDSFLLNLTDDTRIEGDISPPSKSTNTLAINTQSTLLISSDISNVNQVQINAGSKLTVRLEKGQFTPEVTVPAGSGMVILSGDSPNIGPVTVAAGQLIVNGSLPHSAIDLQAGATLRGSGSVGTVSGGGTIWPGTSLGILTASALAPTATMKLAFEFGSAQPDYQHPLHSKNDLLVLTADAPFEKPLAATNEIDIYLRTNALHAGDTFTGGIFCKSAFLPQISTAAIHYFIADSRGTVLHGPTHFAAIDPKQYSITLETVPATAQLAATAQSGYVTTFTVGVKKLSVKN